MMDNYYFAGFTFTNDVAAFNSAADRDRWVDGFNGINLDPVAAEDRIALTLDDVYNRLYPVTDSTIAYMVETTEPDDNLCDIRWLDA